MHRKKIAAIFTTAVLLTGLLTAACTPHSLKIGHVQGLAYSPDGQTLYLATDAQIIQYNSLTGWSQTPSDANRTVQQLALNSTPSDLKATAQHTRTTYVWNKETGLRYSQDAGNSWTHVAAQGLEGANPLCLAVHPDDDRWVAIGTSQGLVFSSDHGETFDQGYPQLENTRVTAVSFDTHNPGLPLLGATYKGSPQALLAPYPVHLFKTSLKGTPEFWHQDFKSLLTLEADDEITHLINNPAGDGYAASTRKGNLYTFDPSHPKQESLIQNSIVHFGSGD